MVEKALAAKGGLKEDEQKEHEQRLKEKISRETYLAARPIEDGRGGNG